MTPAQPADERHSADGGSKLVDALALASVAAVVLLLKLGAGSLAAWDEAIYAQVSKEMARGGDWLTPHWAHEPWFEKPPLFIWTTAAFFKLFGVSEFWARAASALSGVALVVVTYLAARRAYERRVGLLAAGVLLTGYHFLSFARFGTTDVMLALFTTLAVYGYLRLRGDEGDGRWWYLVWLAVALALMLKGAGGLVAPAAVALALAFDGRLGAAPGSRHFRLGGLLALLIVAPWHVLMFARNGRAFADEYVGYHVVARLTRPLEGHATGYLYYVARLIDGFFPWCLLAPFALVSGVRENVKGESRSRVFLIVAALVFAAYTLIPTRRPWYVLPAYPALAILTAAFVVRLYHAWQSRPIYRRLVVAPACALLLFVGGAYSALSLRLNQNADAPLAELSRLAAGAADNAPLVLFSEAEPFYAQTALFYSDRPVRQAYAASKPPGEDAKRYVDYESLDAVLGGETRRIILSRDDATRLSAGYEIEVLAEAGPLVYATVRRKG
ncbi:MAG TPA: glycosyltransferase family 39 protein [Pyrinomonadaceae bacterium]|nr:glycosyltransferase family 39 protein [Pyrinomonadaceae bacterium]